MKQLAKNNKDELIPTMKIKDNRHWIEWVLIIECMDDTKKYNFGISFKYQDNEKKITATSVTFDRKDIEYKHKLTGMNSDRFNHMFESFNSDVNALNFIMWNHTEQYL